MNQPQRIAALVLLASAASPPLLAQEDEAPADVQHLEDIVVTATKRERSARDIPVSISAVRGEDLEKMGARDIKDYMMLVPGLTMDESNRGDAGGRRLTIRGVGPSAVDGNQTVGQFIGDIPLTDPVGNRMTPDLDPFDLKTVEVLKGPQGTTFGATALNGALRYVPNPAELQRWEARGFADFSQVKYGSPNHSFAAALNAPVGETLALRAAGIVQDSGGLYDNRQRNRPDSDSAGKWSGRGMLHWAPLEPLAVDLMVLKQHRSADDLLTGDEANSFSNNYKPGPSNLATDFSLASIDARYSLQDWGSLVWQSSLQSKHVDIDADGSLQLYGQYGLAPLRGYTQTDVDGRTHELRWVSAEGERWSWIVGAFMQNYRLTYGTGNYVTSTSQLGVITALLPILNTPLTPDAFSSRGITILGSTLEPLDAEERSIYGELSRRIGEHWELTLGGRRYQTSIVADAGSNGAGTITAVYNNGGKVDVHVEQADSGFSPKLSLAWKPSGSLMLYALVSKGFQFGGLNPPPTLNFPNPVFGTYPLQYKSSELWNREIGLRSDWLDRTLRLDATVYDIDWSQAQIQQYTQGVIFPNTYTSNIGRVRSRGIESTLTWLTPISGLSTSLATAWSRAVSAASSVNNGVTTPAGATMPAAPPLQLAATANYSTYFGAWTASSGLTWSYWSKTYNDLQHTFELYNFSQLSLNASIARPDWPGAPSLDFGVQNVLDEKGLIGRTGNGGGGFLDYGSLINTAAGEGWTYIRPRTLSFRLAAQF